MAITTKQFLWAILLLTVGFVFLVMFRGETIFLFVFPVLASNFVLMPQAERTRPLTRTQLLRALFLAVGTAIFIWWSITQRDGRPSSESSGRTLIAFVSHPSVACLIWLTMVAIGYRRWRFSIKRSGVVSSNDESTSVRRHQEQQGKTSRLNEAS